MNLISILFIKIVVEKFYFLFPPINLEISQIINATPPKIKIKAHHIPALKMVFTTSQLVNKEMQKMAKKPSVNFFIAINIFDLNIYPTRILPLFQNK